MGRSTGELEEFLNEQIGFLRLSADAYDDGKHAESKRLASTLRTLLHQTKTSKALLGQLGRLETTLFFSSALPTHSENILPELGLIAISSRSTHYEALLDGVPPPARNRRLPFQAWWNEVVFRHGANNAEVMTRRRLVLSAANKEGGSHVDEAEPDYAQLNADRLRWFSGVTGSEVALVKGAPAAALRQIAHEVLRSLVPDYSKSAQSAVGIVVSQVQVFPRDLSEDEILALYRNTAPPRFVQTPARVAPQPNQQERNEKCACKSGKKFKVCCGNPPLK